MHMVAHHGEDEETTLFENGKKIISEKKSVTLVDEMEDLKEHLRSSKKFEEAYGE